ncbi:MAG: cupin domain-containing protein [Candidatus Velamenicoccus archaeovorus]
MRSVAVSRAMGHPHPRPEWFTGHVLLQEMNDADTSPALEILAVFFERGARTIPHVHSTDQLLYFVEGVGVVGTIGRRVVYRPGGMAIVPANEWHWHGATPGSPVCHLSIRPGGATVWAPDVPMHDWETYMAGATDDS